MSGLSEQYVQRKAQAFLERRYRGWGKALFSKMEVKTKKVFGGKRADGLIAFRRWIWGTYVVSMEAKSYKTLNAILPYRSIRKWFWSSLLAGFYTCLSTGALLALYRMNDGFVQYFFPLNMFLLGALLYALLTRNSVQHQVADVIEQLKQYPANEQWLAFSKDSLNRLSKRKKRVLARICKQEGIGVLIVARFGRVHAWIKPKRRWKWKGDFLSYYSLEQQIRQKIA